MDVTIRYTTVIPVVAIKASHETRIKVSATDNQIKELPNPRRGTIRDLSRGKERKQVEKKSENFHSLSLVSESSLRK